MFPSASVSVGFTTTSFAERISHTGAFVTLTHNVKREYTPLLLQQSGTAELKSIFFLRVSFLVRTNVEMPMSNN